jgi:hypothetical protein
LKMIPFLGKSCTSRRRDLSVVVRSIGEVRS